MRKKPICAQLATLFLASTPAFAQDAANWEVGGSATVGAIYNSTSNTKDDSKLLEYRDLRNGAITTVDPISSANGGVPIQTCINAAAGPCTISN